MHFHGLYITFVKLQNTLVLIFVPLTDAACVPDGVETFLHHILHSELTLTFVWQEKKRYLNAIHT